MRKDVAFMINESRDNNMEAIKELAAGTSSYASESRPIEVTNLRNDILDAIAEVKSGLGSREPAPPWTEVVKRRRPEKQDKMAPIAATFKLFHPFVNVRTV